MDVICCFVYLPTFEKENNTLSFEEAAIPTSQNFDASFIDLEAQ